MGKRGQRLLRENPVLLGFLCGLVGFVVTVGLLWLWMSPFREPSFNVQLDSSGGAISRHAGRRLVLSHEHGSLTQTCNGACDDLSYRAKDGDNTYRLQVLNAAGECLACATGIDVMGGYGGLSARWRVVDHGSLKIVASDQIASGSWHTARPSTP